MNVVKLSARAKELPTCGCALQFSMETEVVSIEAACFPLPAGPFETGRGKRLIAVVNRHTRLGETHESYDLRLEGNPEAMELLGKRILEAVKKEKVRA